MTDRFQNYADLSAEMLRDDDYQIRAEDRGSAVIIIAPHGGTIEPETSLIAEAIAGSDYSYYLFEALKAGAHGDFHITSHHFDEPQALELVASAQVAVAIHGRKDDGTETVWLGARAEARGEGSHWGIVSQSEASLNEDRSRIIVWAFRTIDDQ